MERLTSDPESERALWKTGVWYSRSNAFPPPSELFRLDARDLIELPRLCTLYRSAKRRVLASPMNALSNIGGLRRLDGILMRSVVTFRWMRVPAVANESVDVSSRTCTAMAC